MVTGNCDVCGVDTELDEDSMCRYCALVPPMAGFHMPPSTLVLARMLHAHTEHLKELAIIAAYVVEGRSCPNCGALTEEAVCPECGAETVEIKRMVG